MDSPGFSPRELAAAPALAPPHQQVVRFQDCDAAGIIFFSRVLEYFHDAYAALLRAEGAPLEEAMRTKRWAAPMKSSEAHFLHPLRFGDPIGTSLVRARLSGSDLEMGWSVSLVAPASLPGSAGGLQGARPAAAVGVLRAVFVDWTTFKRVAPPEDVARIFTRIQASQAAPG